MKPVWYWFGSQSAFNVGEYDKGMVMQMVKDLHRQRSQSLNGVRWHWE